MESKSITRTKRAIKAAFIDLILMKSFDEITISEIIEASGYSRSTFYKYYDDKFDLASRMFKYQIEDFISTIIRSAQENLPADEDRTAYEMIYGMYRHIEDNKDFYSLLVDEKIPGYSMGNAADMMYKKLMEIIEIDDEKWRNDIDRSYYFYMVANDIMLAIKYWLSNDYVKTAKDMCELTMSMYRMTGYQPVAIKPR